MLSRSMMDSQTVLIKSGLNPTEFNGMTLISIKSKPIWPKILGHFVINGTCLSAGPRPSADQNFTLVQSKTSEEVFELIQDVFPQLSYIDFALLFQSVAQTPKSLLFEKISFEELLQHFHVKMSLDVQDLLQLLLQLPENVQNSLHDKRWLWGDLQIFLSLRNLSEVAKTHLENLFALHLSKSEMVQCCELLIECLLLEKAIDSANWTNHNVKEALRTLRFPQQQGKEKSAHPAVKSVQIKPTRQNDRQGYEFKFFSANSVELNKILQKIQTSEMDWSQQ